MSSITSWLARSLLLFILVCNASISFANEVILAFGDSLTSGYRIARSKSWVSLLDQAIPAKVINASVSGNTSAQGLARLPRALKKHQPDMVILALGANDGLQGLPVLNLKNNLDRMIQLCQAQQAQVFLFSIELPIQYGPHYSKQFLKVYQDLSQKYNLPLIHFKKEEILFKPEWMQRDKVHPNEKAQPYIFQKVFKNLMKKINKPKAL